MKKPFLCEIVSENEIAEGIFDVVVRSSEMAREAKPGQFLHIDCGDGINTFLRRPISICDAFGDCVRFIFEVKGSGTNVLAGKNVGDALDILGPLGNGFSSFDKYKNPVIIGGGIGVYPLYFLAKTLKKPAVFLGFRNKEKITLVDEFKNISDDVNIATDDGSQGYFGNSVNMFKESGAIADIIYACGPAVMLKAVQSLAGEMGIKCQLSLEQRMGCGIGACLVCACETVLSGDDKYKHVCKDGPVFMGDEVVL